MINVLENQKGAIAKLCRKYNVERLFAFGSAIRDDYRPGESDVDLLVEFAPIGGHAKFHAYFEMLDELQQLLGSKVDLVMSGAVRNEVIAREIEKTKRIIYASWYLRLHRCTRLLSLISRSCGANVSKYWIWKGTPVMAAPNNSQGQTKNALHLSRHQWISSLPANPVLMFIAAA
jgi:predicted nucleotidyltransferase